LNAIEHNNKAITLYNAKQYKDAQEHFKKAIDLDPQYAEAYANLGALYAKFKDYDIAIKLYHKCMAIKPKYAGAYTNLGNALNKTAQYEEAIYFHKIAISLDPKSANHFANCASAYKNLGRFNKARQLYIKAISLEPTHINAHFDLATLYLQTGEYEKGLKEYEWRFKKDEMQGHIYKYKTIFKAKPYRGETLKGERVLVHAEQGFGDTIMMARYLMALKEKGATVVLYLRKGLRELFQTMECVDEIYDRKEPVPKFDYQIAFMSLAIVLDKKLENLTTNYPYFEIDETYRLKKDADKLNIGIVWSASKTGESYKNKVFDLRHFSKMSKSEEIQIYSLQLGEDTKDLKKYGLQNNIIDLSEKLDNFLDTAKMINALDLIITSDTSVAHLAGSMGKKVWLILQKVPDWRWGVDEKQSSWYPSIKIFHQYSLGDFNSAFRQVYQALKQEYGLKVLND